ncbi:MAG: hypothetical protein EBU88_06635, partial [Acidobacteria bacterium]|nr:hypothetical protein [Acidobacteriota bacterium]
ILNAALRAISANPPVWSRLQEQKLVEPLVRGLLIPLKADGTGILTGARCVECASRLLQLLARRGQLVIEKKIDLNTLQAFLTMTVKRLEREMGRTIDGEAQPYLIERIATAILDTPARLKLRPEAFIEEILPAILTDLGSLWGRG